jgi:inosose dehydratase
VYASGNVKSTTPLTERLAGAPISWGVCEVPGWGLQLDRERVLGEIRAVGLRVTEAGPDGYLPDDPGETRELLARYELELVGGFLPLALHDPAAADEQLAFAEQKLSWFQAAGARFVTTALVVDPGWSPRIELEPAGWGHLLGMLDRLDELCAGHGLVQAVHPHVGTLVQTADEVERVLEGSAAGLCLDTGHLLIGGADPAALLRAHPQRFVYVHLKDVSIALAGRVARGELSLAAATQAGLFRPLGEGDAPVGEVIELLEGSGYRGWLVLEQDCALDAVPPPGAGPIDEVRRSIEFVAQAVSHEVAHG